MAAFGAINEWVAILANWLSLASFGVSVYAAVTIAKVRREIVARATLPSVLSALDDNRRVIGELVGDPDENRRGFELEIARCQANLRTIVATRSLVGPRAQALIALIERFPDDQSDPASPSARSYSDRAWRIHTSLTGLVEELKRVSDIQRIGG